MFLNLIISFEYALTVNLNEKQCKDRDKRENRTGAGVSKLFDGRQCLSIQRKPPLEKRMIAQGRVKWC